MKQKDLDNQRTGWVYFKLASEESCPYAEVEVWSVVHGGLLGMIKWYGTRANYMFVPEPHTPFAVEQMVGIASALRLVSDRNVKL